MSIRRIVLYPDEALRRPAQPVDTVDAAVRTLVEDLFETMYAAPGVGLAAPQVGVSRRVLVMDPGGEPRSAQAQALINPRVVERHGETVWEEGCLSIPGYYADVVRAAQVRVEALDADGAELDLTLDGFGAVVAQHEIDHLDGILFVDRLPRAQRRQFERTYGKDPYRDRGTALV